jgi:hypothetical protein
MLQTVSFGLRSLRAFSGLAAATALFVALGASAKASIIFDGNGTAASDGRDQNAEATFDIFATTITVALENTGGPGQVGGISSSLTGIQFSLDGGTATLTLASLTGSAPSGALDCTAGLAACTSVAAPASPFGWTVGAGPAYLLSAGNGSFKPYGIMNDNVTGDTDGTSNAQHNPWLDGIVTFTISFAGGTAPTGISDVTFFFGTAEGDTQPGIPKVPLPPVPEPVTSALVGTGLLSLFFLRRRIRG